MTKHWNDEMIELETRDNLTIGQTVAMEGWDLRWEIERPMSLIVERKGNTMC